MAKTVAAQAIQNQGPKSIFSPLDFALAKANTTEMTTDNDGNPVPASFYYNAKGDKVTKNESSYSTGDQDYGQQLEIHAGPTTYTAPLKVGNQIFDATYGENGDFQIGYGKEFYQNGHHWLPVLDAQGNVSYTNNDQHDGFGDFAKMVALSALTAGFGGAAGVGQNLFGLSGTAGQIAGGAALGAGRAAISGGDILKGAFTGGLGGAGNLGIGDTGFTVGQVMTAANAVKAAEKGDWMNAITGAASLSGAGSTQIGDTGYTLGDLAKNAKLAQSILSGKGNLQSVLSAITSVAGSANKDVIQTLTDAGMSGPQAKDFIDSLSPYESKNPNALLDLAVGNQQKSAEADQPAIDARTQDIIKQLEKAGVTIDEAATDWAALYAQETTDPVTGKTIKGVDVSTYAPQNLNIDPAQWDSYTKNLQSIIDKGGYTSQWQTVGTDRIMVQDDGTAIATNENGDPYSLTKTQVDQMVQNGILNTANSGYVAATGGTGNNPGGTKTTTPVGGTKTTTPATQTTTPAASTPTTSSTPTATRIGLDPLDVLKMKNDVAHIKSLEELFGGSIYDHTPASSAQDQTDVVEAATGGQIYSSGGDIHALLQLLRS